jgi:hypothetical protein
MAISNNLFSPFDLFRSSARPFEQSSASETSSEPSPSGEQIDGLDLDVSGLSDEERRKLQAFIKAHANEFDGAIDTPEELRHLLQLLHQGEGKTSGLPDLETKASEPAIGAMSLQEMLQLLAEYFANYERQNGYHPRMAGTLGYHGGGGGAPNAGTPSGPIERSTAGATGSPDIKGFKNLSLEQQANAQVIIDEGRKMGASERDIQVALMTALQESGLRNLNYGDRDSLGLFQQRPSAGWGTQQQVTNPHYAAQKFYEHLLRIPNRDQMSLTQEAQKVQASAFPDAYAKWQDLALAIVTSSGGGRSAANVA